MKKTEGGVVIGGYYGFGNLGDETILRGICASLKEVMDGEKICVLSATPKETALQYGVCSVSRTNIAAIIEKMSRSSLYISGGGGLLQDDTSRRSLLYYSTMMLLGKKLCGHLYVYANGVGNVKRSGHMRRALIEADRVSVRDDTSAARLEKLGIGSHVAADPAWRFASLGTRREKYGYFAVCLRSGGNINEETLENFCAEYSRRGLYPLFVSMHDGADLGICSDAAKRCGGRCISPVSFEGLMYILSGAEFAIGMRLHFLIAAAACGVPFVGLGSDCKLFDFVSLWGRGEILSESCGADRLFSAVSKAEADAESAAASAEVKSKMLAELFEKEDEILKKMCLSLCCGGSGVGNPIKEV